MKRAVAIAVLSLVAACGGRVVAEAGVGLDADVRDGGLDADVGDEDSALASDGLDATVACMAGYAPPSGPSTEACTVPCSACTCGRVPCGPSCCPFPGMWCDLRWWDGPMCRAIATENTHGNGPSSLCDFTLIGGQWIEFNVETLPLGRGHHLDWQADSGVPGCALCQPYRVLRPPDACSGDR